MSDVLMSIHPRHVAKILSGEKTVEIRRRRVAFSPGTRIWIYSTLPIGAIEASVDVLNVGLASPSATWARYRDQACISRQEFNLYTEGAAFVSAITLSNVRPLLKPISLKALRSEVDNFAPPQSYYYLSADSIALRLISYSAFQQVLPPAVAA